MTTSTPSAAQGRASKSGPRVVYRVHDPEKTPPGPKTPIPLLLSPPDTLPCEDGQTTTSSPRSQQVDSLLLAVEAPTTTATTSELSRPPLTKRTRSAITTQKELLIRLYATTLSSTMQELSTAQAASQAAQAAGKKHILLLREKVRATVEQVNLHKQALEEGVERYRAVRQTRRTSSSSSFSAAAAAAGSGSGMAEVQELDSRDLVEAEGGSAEVVGNELDGRQPKTKIAELEETQIVELDERNSRPPAFVAELEGDMTFVCGEKKKEKTGEKATEKEMEKARETANEKIGYRKPSPLAVKLDNQPAVKADGYCVAGITS